MVRPSFQWISVPRRLTWPDSLVGRYLPLRLPYWAIGVIFVFIIMWIWFGTGIFITVVFVFNPVTFSTRIVFSVIVKVKIWASRFLYAFGNWVIIIVPGQAKICRLKGIWMIRIRVIIFFWLNGLVFVSLVGRIYLTARRLFSCIWVCIRFLPYLKIIFL